MNKYQCLLFMAIILLGIVIILAGCDKYDNNYIPYGLKGLNVLVYDNKNGKEYYGGMIEANYLSKDKALAECGSRAYALAQQFYLQDWSYVCCTVTSSSDCVTKVR